MIKNPVGYLKRKPQIYKRKHGRLMMISTHPQAYREILMHPSVLLIDQTVKN